MLSVDDTTTDRAARLTLRGWTKYQLDDTGSEHSGLLNKLSASQCPTVTLSIPLKGGQPRQSDNTKSTLLAPRHDGSILKTSSAPLTVGTTSAKLSVIVESLSLGP